MNKIIVLLLLTLFSNSALSENQKEADKPNFLLIVADDLGYSDLGSFGGEIQTPHLDALANKGVKFTNFYSAPTCSPARAMMLSGMDNHLVGLGTQKYYWAEEQKGRPGYEGYLNNRFVTVATRLKDAGYHTYMVGKWHLGYDESSYPSSRGFEESFALVEGGASHLDQRGVIPKAAKANYIKDGKPVDLPEDFFSSAFYTDTLINNIESHRKDGKPFFAYAAYTAPHWPLQAPKAFLDKYQGVYDQGYGEIAQQRLTRMQEMAIVDENAVVQSTPDFYPKWNKLTPSQQAREARLMEVYAAMVDALDYNIGRLIEYLKKTKQFENTVIVFVSDNGAEGADPMDITTPAQPNAQWIPENFDNSFANIGKANSFVSVGPGWAGVSSTPSRLFKGFTAEGGIKVPAFIFSPKLARQSHLSHEFVSVKDIAPTFLELAGIPLDIASHNERPVLPMTGKSMLSYLMVQEDTLHGADFSEAWELFGRRAVRSGDWKMIWLNDPWGNNRWQLYNLANDPAESKDVFSQFPEVVAKLSKIWEQYVAQNEMVVVDKVDIQYTNGTSHYQHKMSSDGGLPN
ncbi:arylsulfatase [Paraglaciecola chathamensis]|jgi:arylsulfatase|uniref:Arylsulfatase n=1 Tax=Paraglaciecola agarilytica NO2 TaxID=1125747 RepID=A0ABQ0IC80_9ALTE|nr:arylsulfatase [Paraglaciecola agarilytica]GAC06882.1 arylsulfatase [Paraglaciecola agarilytica NO2]